MSVLEIRNLTKSYGSARVLSDLSLSVAQGEIVAVLGASGAGKSTLFRCITRLTEPDAGEIVLAGAPIHQLEGRRLAAARSHFGVVFQQFNLIRRRSAIENVLAGRIGKMPLWRVATGMFASEDRARAWVSLTAVGLERWGHQRADTLSGGQQQRVAIARALAQESRVLLADEPVASLDPETAETIMALLQSLARQHGLTIVCSLHQPLLAERYADRILTLENGSLSG